MQMDLHKEDREESDMSQLFGMNNALSRLTETYENKVNGAATKGNSTQKTIGNPKLSDAASAYYNELKSKNADMEFILVDDENTATAKEQAAGIRSDKSMFVIISESEVEKMASDDAVRTKNENLIAEARTQMSELSNQLKESGVSVKSFGIEFSDGGTASYFAVLDKSAAAQKERIEKAIAEKRAEKKEAEKENLTTVSAASMEELMKKLRDIAYETKADSLLTEQEKMIGQGFDLSL